jgi:serine phosphatase RsbU (regulator of sigma subunit)
MQLGAAGFTQVTSASSPAEALHLLGIGDESNAAAAGFDLANLDLIMLDVVMPGMDGVEVCRRIKASERLRDVPVIMVTAQTETEHLAAAFASGAMDYITKPANEVELLARVRSALRLKHETDQRKARERQIDDQRRQLEAELARAALVQAELLPRGVPPLPGFDLAARCVPAREVGGDFYDWQQTAPNTLTFTVGDVMGKGMPAALLMATVRAALRAVARQSPPAETIHEAAAALEVDLERSGSFVTLFHGRLDATTGRLDYVDAGHGHVLLRRADGTVTPLPARGLPVGVLPDHVYRQASVSLSSGDILVVYSDGLLDARPDLALHTETIAACLNGATNADDVVRRLFALAALTGPPPDDLTVVALCCLEAGAQA